MLSVSVDVCAVALVCCVVVDCLLLYVFVCWLCSFC